VSGGAPGRALLVLQPDDGGVRQHVAHLAAGLVRRGWEVDVAASASAGPGSAYRGRLEAAGVTVHALPMTRVLGDGDLRAARALRRLDRARRFDVVHAHSSKAGALVRTALPRRDRLVYTPHCFAFAAGLGPARAAYWLAEQLLLVRCAAVIVVSEWERDLALRRLVGARRRLRLIRNGVPDCGAAEPHPGLAALRGDGPLTGFLARLEPQKDPLAFVRACAVLRDRGALRGRAVLVGSGSLEGAVCEAITARGLGEVVHWLPFDAPVERYLAALDLYVLPSLWESMPLAALEAMACGLPVLATDAGGTAEVVRDGETGRLVAPGDVPALADALDDLTADPERLRALGAAGRAAQAARFGVERMVDEVDALYRGLA
jgi:glycosyltransferase involved in cell wall biosynthesis